MVLNQLSYEYNQNNILSNLLISKISFYNYLQLPQIKKIKFLHFFKTKKKVVTLKNVFFLIGLLNCFIKVKKNKKKLQYHGNFSTKESKYSFLFFLLVFREILILTAKYPAGATTSMVLRSIQPFFTLFEIPKVRLNLSKDFSFRIIFYFTKKQFLFSYCFLLGLF